MRKFYHIVYQGEGRFWPNAPVDSEPVLIKAGDIFLIPPSSNAVYQGDNSNPWSYYWLGIQGQMAEAALELAGFNSQQQTLHYPMTIIHSIIEEIQSLTLSSEEHSVNPLEKLSLAYRIGSYWIPDCSTTLLLRPVDNDFNNDQNYGTHQR